MSKEDKNHFFLYTVLLVKMFARSYENYQINDFVDVQELRPARPTASVSTTTKRPLRSQSDFELLSASERVDFIQWLRAEGQIG